MSALAVATPAGPEDAEDPASAAREELGAFGNGLKAAVRTGAMSEEDASGHVGGGGHCAFRLEFPDEEKGEGRAEGRVRRGNRSQSCWSPVATLATSVATGL